jgi:hypothetical protein
MNNIKKYIDAEKDISRFRLNALKRLTKPYAKRLAEKEKRFLGFDFMSCNFKDIEEARISMDLFRSSEREFYIQYGFEVREDAVNYDAIIEFLKESKGYVLCNKYSYLDYANRSIFNSDKSIKKVICDRNIFLSDFISYIIKNINLIDEELEYNELKSKVIKSMFEDGMINNAEDLFVVYKDSIGFNQKTDITKLISFGLEHSGNEKIVPISCNVNAAGKNFNILKFNNIKKNGKYFKALKICDENLSKVGDINIENSYCLVFKTRRSTESFLQIEKNIKIILKQLADKFNINITF